MTLLDIILKVFLCIVALNFVIVFNVIIIVAIREFINEHRRQ